MQQDNERAGLLRQDRRGRVRTPLAQRSALLAEFARSGLSGARFAALHGINYQTFAGWRRKSGLAGANGDGAGPTDSGCGLPGGPSQAPGVLTWLEAVAGPRRAGLEIHLPGGAKTEVADAAQASLAAHLLWALAGAGPVLRLGDPALGAAGGGLPC